MRLAVYIAGNAIRERFENPISILSLLLFGAIVVAFITVGYCISLAISKRGERKAQNKTEFYGDEILETKKLERTLAVALLAVAVIAIAISLYYIWEPTRQAQMTTSFETRSVRRGQTLYANESTKGYSPTQSLACANCHGGYNADTGRWAEGGSAQYTLKSLKDPNTDPACADDKKFTNPDCVTVSVAWKAPALNTVLYKYPIRKAEENNPFKSSCVLSEQRTTPDCRSQVYDILTYGRPGTPMPAWGVAGGGAKNEQAINDLVDFLASIQLPADQAAQPLRSAEIIMQKNKIKTAREALVAAKEKVLESGVAPADVKSDASVVAAQEALDVEKTALKAIEAKTETQYLREKAISDAQAEVAKAQKAVDEEVPAALASAQKDYDAALQAYQDEPAFDAYPNPQAYLDELDKKQTEIKLEKKVEEAKTKGNKKVVAQADAELLEVLRLKNIASNLIEARDALATAKATSTIFAPEALSNSKARLAQLQSESDGQLLFESNCARCHTKGWSYFTPSDGRVPLPAPQGTGAFGPALETVNLKRQFMTSDEQYSFISSGSSSQAVYGSRGVGTGRMPGSNSVAGRVLEDDQIRAIVEYERNDLTGAGTNSLGTRNLGSGVQPDKGGK